ncbi:acyl-CoA thioesterase II [Enemella evansiae]|uniref:Acyl-CoA thioesterase II n=1 Tax=Enemella evansiae TaxID=2016499 RepID=A0A255GAQ3_9ACTN|nr:acyl-CoA thioesterase domain-containing protein [Enemella evansiae]OYO12925.1 acyl-CoA thioesterase II [Enemella evansiae]
MPTSDTLLAALELTEVPPELFDRAWLARTQYCPWPKAYGGDMVAQAARAAMLSCPDKTMHSMHSYFMRPVDIGAEVRYEVEVLRDGRGYATRQVRALQNGKVVYVCLASFHAAPELGEPIQPTMPGSMPDPESLPSSAEYLEGRDDEASRYWAEGRSFDMRHVPGPVYLTVEGDQVPHQAVWVKSFAPLPDDPQLHAAALAYVCDYTIIEPTLRALGWPWEGEGRPLTASLDHAMWFHRPARVDGWLLYAQESGWYGHERGLGTGRFFTPAGELIATVAQEAMVRRP